MSFTKTTWYTGRIPHLPIITQSNCKFNAVYSFKIYFNISYQITPPAEAFLQQTVAYSNIYPIRCNVTRFILSGNCSTYFRWHHHPSSGAQTTVSIAPGICHTVTATCRYRGRVGTGLSVLWVAGGTTTHHQERKQLYLQHLQ